MTRKLILLIDDDPVFLMLTRKLLEDQPILKRIDTVNEVAEAKQYFQKLAETAATYPDAVFIDLDMPEINGLELAKQLHDHHLKQQPGSSIFILSSSISQRERKTAERLEAVTDFMEKPLSAEKLQQALARN